MTSRQARVDRVGDVGVQLDAAVGVAGGAILVELAAALVAEAGPQMVLAAAAVAAIRQLAAGHGHERALGAFDDLQVADDEGVVERHRAEGLQALVLVVVFHELDTDFGDDHSLFSFFLWHTQSQLRTTKTRAPAPTSRAEVKARAIRMASAGVTARANTVLPLPLINTPAGLRLRQSCAQRRHLGT